MCAARVDVFESVQVYWQPPPSSVRARGLIFVAHGMQHGAYDFFANSDAIPDGVGLPEEVRVIKACRERGYAVAAISSLDRRGKAWDPINDAKRVVSALRALRQSSAAEHGGFGSLPLIALGISNGGAFVLELVASGALSVQGVVSQIMAAPHLARSARLVPPTAFIHMARDKQMAAAVNAHAAGLRSRQCAVKVFECAPVPIGATFFSTRIRGLPVGHSAKIANALANHGFVDSERMLRDDPRSSGWRAALFPLGDSLGGDSLIADQSPIAEVLNVAWAAHEATAEHVDAALAFLEDQRDSTIKTAALLCHQHQDRPGGEDESKARV